jgi:hypothetical protein
MLYRAARRFGGRVIHHVRRTPTVQAHAARVVQIQLGQLQKSL